MLLQATKEAIQHQATVGDAAVQATQHHQARQEAALHRHTAHHQAHQEVLLIAAHLLLTQVVAAVEVRLVAEAHLQVVAEVALEDVDNKTNGNTHII